MTKLLLQYGAKLGVLYNRNGNRITPIQSAARDKWWEGVIAIATARKETRLRLHNFGAALVLAAESNQLPAVAALLAANAPTHWLSGKDGNSSLHWAVKNKNHRMIALLLWYGCETNYCDKHGTTATELAISCQRTYPDDANYLACIKALSDPASYLPKNNTEILDIMPNAPDVWYLERVRRFLKDYNGIEPGKTFDLSPIHLIKLAKKPYRSQESDALAKKLEDTFTRTDTTSAKPDLMQAQIEQFIATKNLAQKSRAVTLLKSHCLFAQPSANPSAPDKPAPPAYDPPSGGGGSSAKLYPTSAYQ